MSAKKNPDEITWLRDSEGRFVPHKIINKEMVSHPRERVMMKNGRPVIKGGKPVTESYRLEFMVATIVPATAAQVEAWRNS